MSISGPLNYASAPNSTMLPLLWNERTYHRLKYNITDATATCAHKVYAYSRWLSKNLRILNENRTLIFTLDNNALHSPLFAQEDTSQLIWHQESQYLQAYRNADHETVLAMWHDDFLGWPSVERQPKRKHNGKDFLNRLYRNPGKWDFSIAPQAIQFTGNIAVTQYLMKSWTAKASGNQVIR